MLYYFISVDGNLAYVKSRLARTWASSFLVRSIKVW